VYEQPSVRRVQEALDSFRPARRTTSERVFLEDAIGRVPAADVRAPGPLPGFVRSAVDGYAVVAADTAGASAQRPVAIELVGGARMGESPPAALRPGTALAVATGCAMPEGADAIVMVEHAVTAGAMLLHVARAARPGQHLIGADDDFATGALLAPAGGLLSAREIAALAAAGQTEVTVRRRARVAILSTGDEVVPSATETLRPGQVRDAIAPAIAALVRAAGGEPVLCGIVRDDAHALEAACVNALERCDVLVLSAGSSVGERDLTARAIARLGPPGIWCHGLALRPGKPTLLAEIGGIPLIGLPGNPLAAFVVFELVGIPIMRRVGGLEHEPVRGTTRATLAVDLPSSAGRVDVVQVRVVDGVAHPLPRGSALLSTLVRADGQVLVPEALAALHAGDVVDVMPRSP
jgi:molybdopterin molybdotransferase